jgi:hypothetical protein
MPGEEPPPAPGPGGRPLRCTFCGRGVDAVTSLIAGEEGHICEACVAQCFAMLCAAIPPRSSTFRFAVRRADGSEEQVAVEGVSFLEGTRSLVAQCAHCGAWNAGAGLADCLHCGAALGGEPLPAP